MALIPFVATPASSISTDWGGSESFISFAPRRQLWRWLGWFAVIQLALASLISIRYFLIAPFADDIAVSAAFALLMVIGHQASIIFLGAIPVFLVSAVLPWRTLNFAIAIFLAGFYLLFLVTDTFVFAQYHFHINAAVWGLLLGGAEDEIFVFSPTVKMIAAMAAISLVTVEVWLAHLVWRRVKISKRSGLRGYLVSALLITTVLAENAIYAWADAASYLPISQQERYLPGYQPAQAKTYLQKWGIVGAKETLTDPRSFKGGLFYPAVPLVCEPKPRYNIVMIVIDSWRFDAFSREVTPNIWRFSRRALVWENHWSGGNATRPGIFSLFYGIPATYWQSALAQRKGSVLVDTLLENGYEPAIYASAKLTSPEFDRTVFASVKNLRTKSPGRDPVERDFAITREFDDYLAKKRDQKPFFAFLFYDSAHSAVFPENYPIKFKPSWKQVNYFELNNDFDPTPYINRYRNSVNFVDSLIAKVLDRLGPRLDNTIVAITADHGQEFNDNHRNYWGHASNYSSAQIHVPMIIRWPGRAPRTIQAQTSHLDFAPTILKEALGCRNPVRDYSVGSSMLVPHTEKAVILASYTDDLAVRRDDFIARVSTRQGVELYRDDGTYTPLNDRKFTASLLRDAVDDLGRFYASAGKKQGPVTFSSLGKVGYADARLGRK